mgnify:CR=1 FL=1
MKSEHPKQKELHQEIDWVRPHIESETGEIERVATIISGSDNQQSPHYKETFLEIIHAIAKAHLEELPDDTWSALENTDSYHEVRPGHIEDVQKLAEKYNKDWRLLLDAIQHNTPIQAPIILIKEDGVPYLVAGNTRLAIARALEARVKALISHLKQPKKP